MNQTECLTLAHDFLDHLFTDLSEKKISFPDHWEIDHLCYRASTDESYQSLKHQFLTFSNLLIESEVNGRLISTFKLHTPIFYKDWMLDLIELPAPKKGKVTASGFEHIEVVTDVTFEALKNLFPEATFDEKGLAKDFNQELELVLGDRNVKFHYLSLESVVTLESNDKVWNAVKDSRILSIFKKYSPLIAGSLPLGFESQEEVIVILMSSSDPSTIKTELKSNYGPLKDFLASEEESQYVWTLNLNGQRFEIRVQKEFSLEQMAYKHFQTEERLLKYGGEAFKRHVQEIMTKVRNTEKAFCMALGTETLDQLSRSSRTHLRQLFTL